MSSAAPASHKHPPLCSPAFIRSAFASASQIGKPVRSVQSLARFASSFGLLSGPPRQGGNVLPSPAVPGAVLSSASRLRRVRRPQNRPATFSINLLKSINQSRTERRIESIKKKNQDQNQQPKAPRGAPGRAFGPAVLERRRRLDLNCKTM